MTNNESISADKKFSLRPVLNGACLLSIDLGEKEIQRILIQKDGQTKILTGDLDQYLKSDPTNTSLRLTDVQSAIVDMCKRKHRNTSGLSLVEIIDRELNIFITDTLIPELATIVDDRLNNGENQHIRKSNTFAAGTADNLDVCLRNVRLVFHNSERSAIAVKRVPAERVVQLLELFSNPTPRIVTVSGELASVTLPIADIAYIETFKCTEE